MTGWHFALRQGVTNLSIHINDAVNVMVVSTSCDNGATYTIENEFNFGPSLTEHRKITALEYKLGCIREILDDC